MVLGKGSVRFVTEVVSWPQQCIFYGQDLAVITSLHNILRLSLYLFSTITPHPHPPLAEVNISAFDLLFAMEFLKFCDMVTSSRYILENWNRCVLPSSLRSYNVRTCLSLGTEAFAAVWVSWSSGVIFPCVLSTDHAWSFVVALKQNC